MAKTVYLNWRGPRGVETVDEFTPGADAPIGKKFRAYVSKMMSEYATAGMNVYRSSRPCRSWKEKST